MDIRPFIQSLQDQGLHTTTIYAHVRKIRYHETFFKDGFTQQEAIELIDTVNTISAKKALAGTISKWLQFHGRENDKIVEKMHSLNAEYAIQSQKKRDAMSNDTSLPTYTQLVALMHDHFEHENWKDYCILYLLLNYHVRNMDMIADVLTTGRGLTKDKNFFVIRASSVVWHRNVYKTVDTYGIKKHIIWNHKFLYAISQLDYVLKPNDNLDVVVKKATGGLNQATVLKIYLSTAKTAKEFKRVSQSRGTDLTTLLNSYDISKKRISS